MTDPRIFQDLRTAGRDLAERLEAFADRGDVIVLGIVLGGVPVAHEVARHLHAPLDFVIVRRLLAPEGPGSQACAVAVAGALGLDDRVPPIPDVPVSGLDHFLKDAVRELEARAETCRSGRPPVDLSGRTVLLVDCGIHTGMTVKAALKAVRAAGPGRVIVAAPVIAPEIEDGALEGANDVVCVSRPHPFVHTGLWYADFTRPGDDEVGALLT